MIFVTFIYDINFQGNMEFYFINITQFIIQSIADWHLGCSQLSSIVWNGAVNLLGMSLVKHVYLFLLGINLGIELVGQMYINVQAC